MYIYIYVFFLIQLGIIFFFYMTFPLPFDVGSSLSQAVTTVGCSVLGVYSTLEQEKFTTRTVRV